MGKLGGIGARTAFGKGIEIETSAMTRIALVFHIFKNRLYASLSSAAVSSGPVGLQCAHAPVSLDALYFIFSALRIGG